MPHVEPLHADDPSHVGRYRLSGRIAGMPGARPVYLARTVDGSDVMITLLDGDWIADPAERDRFTEEANAASMVAPFCAARILGAGFDGKQAFLVSEYVPGPSLRELVTEEGPWEGRDLEALAIGTATGLAAIHQAGLVHGGFGPQYVVLSPDGPRVIEFGITPPYGSATPGNDMRAWARTLLFAAAGAPPDPAYNDLELLPEPLRELASRCLSGGPDQPTARSVVIELLGDDDPPAGVLAEGARRAAPAAAPPIPEGAQEPPRQDRTRRTVTLWWAVGVAVCIVAIALVIHVLQSKSDQPSPPSGRFVGVLLERARPVPGYDQDGQLADACRERAVIPDGGAQRLQRRAQARLEKHRVERPGQRAGIIHQRERLLAAAPGPAGDGGVEALLVFVIERGVQSGKSFHQRSPAR